MTIDIVMPQLGESVTEGTISRWLKKPGDEVEEYEPICEVETDKVNTEIPSLYNGKMGEILAQEGQTVAVGEIICKMEVESETVSQAVESDKPISKTQERNEADTSMKHRYSPAVLRLAQENQIDLTKLSGSGKGGRITRKDVLHAVENKSAVSIPAKNVTAPVEKRKVKETPPLEILVEDKIVPVSSIRRTIAERMVKSKTEIPHAWTMMEADVSGLVALRNKYKNDFAANGIPLTFMPFFIKATVDTLREFPYVNSVWAEDKIVLKKDINISVAIAANDALYVPVIHQADEKNIFGIARSLQHLIHKTRNGNLGIADTQGGTFTVNNTGSFGSIASQPIINQPQVAILSFESIVKKPVVIDDMIAIRNRMNLCLSLDHRVLDGLTAGQFLARVKERLESYQVDTAL
ncbi:2-oxo acid dehydrogenase subunit E2 [Shimazuella sp. AN120528]|uniref:dihydrolipoamide acetyltransferase family protein n=1 Tax=Shimazuella soli TaxID=1892854 RepID=UPI001F0DF8C5|nr:dihydrolipoamide acetyltransferase family protein [Shimazuella soli]MCH5584222.1 2-oxo acid dehydrogenase subunit E2 [Shimazuella soli]